jgi:Uma2 family endonuclease
MAARPRKSYNSVADVLAIPWDGKRRELIGGRMYVTPAPVLLHERAVMRLYDLVHPYASTLVGETFANAADIVLTPDTLVQPDLFVVPREPGVRLLEWQQITRLWLTVEVISPRTAHRDRTIKRDYYMARHVPEYWIVDHTARHVERWRPDLLAADVVRDTLIWQPVPETPALSIDLAHYFQRVFDEA